MEREENFDMLRVFSAFAVILLHVNWKIFKPKADVPMLELNYIVESSINILSRFCVPCFFMLSGAFVMKKYKKTGQQDVKKFYKNAMYKIFLPAVIIYGGYCVLDLMKHKATLFLIIKGTITGGRYNFWYVYTACAIYLFVPLLFQLKKSMNAVIYEKFVWSFLLWAIISQITSTHKLAYGNGVVLSFLAYFVLGDYIYCNKHKFVNKTFLCSVVIVIAYMVTFALRFIGIEKTASSPYIVFFSPTIAAMSVAAFIIACNLKVKMKFSKIANYTYYIYLFHTAIYTELLKHMENVYRGGGRNRDDLCSGNIDVCFFTGCCCNLG